MYGPWCLPQVAGSQLSREDCDKGQLVLISPISNTMHIWYRERSQAEQKEDPHIPPS